MAVKVKKSTAQKSSSGASPSSDTGTTASPPKMPRTTIGKKKREGGDAKEKKEKKPRPKSEKREKRSSDFNARLAYAAGLMFEQKYTDEQIKEMVAKKFPGYSVIFDQKEMGRTRWMLRNDMIKGIQAGKRPFERMFAHEGKLYPRKERPRKASTRKPKIDPEKDPLRKVAGIDPDAQKGASKASGGVAGTTTKKKKIRRS